MGQTTLKCAPTYYTIIPMPSQFSCGKDAVQQNRRRLSYNTSLVLLAPTQLVQMETAVACMSIFFDNRFMCCVWKEQSIPAVKYFLCESASPQNILDRVGQQNKRNRARVILCITSYYIPRIGSAVSFCHSFRY